MIDNWHQFVRWFNPRWLFSGSYQTLFGRNKWSDERYTSEKIVSLIWWTGEIYKRMEKRRKTIRQREPIEFEIRKKTQCARVCIFLSNRNEFSFARHTNSSLTITHTQSKWTEYKWNRRKNSRADCFFHWTLVWPSMLGDQIERPGLFTFSHCIANWVVAFKFTWCSRKWIGCFQIHCTNWSTTDTRNRQFFLSSLNSTVDESR